MTCHGEMADLRPRPEFLSLFYLLLSAGGALGGIFVALVAPLVFRGFYELPLALGMCVFFVLVALLHKPLSLPKKLARPILVVEMAIAALLVAFLLNVVQQQSRRDLLMTRNFYGVYASILCRRARFVRP